ncbi:hypothetical protein J1782_08630 [Rahnella sp. BCC 1045]|uniref:hypothetical protein n=1 Tax=Rahnella sp. BCC 1045 TaxID=2816251 RepID=UPI001C2522DC|nr:hypothetical protein [Rahnella sp. BCC 1045]MBU9819952.1 hypothetical protein [Rahnella sp. BCC 1045]
MPNIADLMIDIDGKKLSNDEYQAHANNASNGIDYIVCGMKSVANLMFWAAANENYADEKTDMQNIGFLISANMSFLEKMLEIESCANFNLDKAK